MDNTIINSVNGILIGSSKVLINAATITLNIWMLMSSYNPAMYGDEFTKLQNEKAADLGRDGRWMIYCQSQHFVLKIDVTVKIRIDLVTPEERL